MPSVGQESAAPPPDSVVIPLNIKISFEIAGPVIYFTDKYILNTDRNILNTEGYVSYDLNEKTALCFGGGYSDYKYSQYNYNYHSNGIFIKTGADLNLIRPELSKGKYWAGIGLRYGISRFTSETSYFKHENYWGTTSSSLPPNTIWGHFLEVSPGFRAEVIKNVSIGWSVNLKKLLYAGAGKDLKPIYFPGYGLAGKSFSNSISYFITYNFLYKKLKVAIKPEAPEEMEETEETQENMDTQSLRNTINVIR